MVDHFGDIGVRVTHKKPFAINKPFIWPRATSTAALHGVHCGDGLGEYKSINIGAKDLFPGRAVTYGLGTPVASRQAHEINGCFTENTPTASKWIASMRSILMSMPIQTNNDFQNDLAYSFHNRFECRLNSSRARF